MSIRMKMSRRKDHDEKRRKFIKKAYSAPVIIAMGTLATNTASAHHHEHPPSCAHWPCGGHHK